MARKGQVRSVHEVSIHFGEKNKIVETSSIWNVFKIYLKQAACTSPVDQVSSINGDIWV